jgi:hypothetical protein
MPLSQPTPLFIVIGIVALAVMAGSVYVGLTAEMTATHPAPAVATTEPAPAAPAN